MDQVNELLKETREIISSFSDIKDPYKLSEVFMKKMHPSGAIQDVVRIRENAAVEFYSGGSCETHHEVKAVNITNFLNRGFLPCKKEEYDQVVKKAVLEINSLV